MRLETARSVCITLAYLRASWQAPQIKADMDLASQHSLLSQHGVLSLACLATSLVCEMVKATQDLSGKLLILTSP